MQLQVKELIPSEHVPPFKQGSGVQSSISVKETGMCSSEVAVEVVKVPLAIVAQHNGIIKYEQRVV